MRTHGLFAGLAAFAAVAFLTLATPPAEAKVDTEHITAMDQIMLDTDMLVVPFEVIGLDEAPVLAEVSKPAAPVPLPPRQIGLLPPGITPAPADRYLC